MDITIQDALVCTPEGLREVSVGIEGEKIVRLGPFTKKEAGRLIPGRGRILFPGGVDSHVHLELLSTSGQTSSDDFFTGSRAALFGGTTTLGDFVYPATGERLSEALKKRRAAVRERCLCRCFLHVAILENPPDLEEQIDECREEGIRSFKVHMNDPRAGKKFLDRVCRHLAHRDCLLLVHAETGREVVSRIRQFIREGETDLSCHPRSRPPKVEADAIEEILRLAEVYGTEVYIVHLSTRLGLEVVKKYKDRGINIFAETCPQYLFLTESEYNKRNGHYLTCTPPFRTKEDCRALWEGLADGYIDTVATDHCPFLKAQKDTWEEDFTRLPFGLPGVETRIPLLFDEGRKKGFSYQLLSELVSARPARIFRLQTSPGEIRPGGVADLFLYDPARKMKINWRQLHMNCDFSPYQGRELTGWPVMTILGGKIWPEDF